MSKKSLLVFLAVATLVVSAPFVRAESVSLTDAQLLAVQNNCRTAQTMLLNTQQSDKLTRINRGHMYETTLQLFVNFNARVVANKVEAPSLINITSDFQTERKTFTDTYTKYDDAVAALTVLDCRSRPVEFYDALGEVRTLREQLSDSVVTIDKYIQNYYDAVETIRGQMVERSGS